MIIHAKVSDADLPKEHYHALLCDPPYHLGPTGFMGKAWDKDGPDAVAFNPATWARLAESLLPGAFGMAFASSRGWHRLAVAIEDAGLIIHPSIFAWAFGSGFPKATRIDTQVDAAVGAEKEVIGDNPFHRENNLKKSLWREAEGRKASLTSSPVLTAPATPLASAWEGHRYGLQAMKPAIEPIILFQKPYKGKPLDCITSTGAGALNIEQGRIDAPEGKTSGGCSGTSAIFGGGIKERVGRDDSCGRWPANFVLDEHLDPILYLKYNVPSDIKMVIREYFDGINGVRRVREGVYGVPPDAQAGEGEVLQQGLLCKMVEQQSEGCQSPDDGAKTIARSHIQNEGHAVTEGLHGAEVTFMEGGETHIAGLRDGGPLDIAKERTGTIWPNGNTEQQQMYSRTSASNGEAFGTTFVEVGSGTPSQRCEGRQQGREPRNVRQLNPQEGAQGNTKRTESITERERGFEVRDFEIAQSAIPAPWLKYFGDTGKKVRTGAAARLDLQSGEASLYAAEDVTGGASRFFHTYGWNHEVEERIEEADPAYYSGKAGQMERNAGLQGQNLHPCVKPIDLTKWLASLLLPPVDYAPRRLLVPFAGSGSEMIGGYLAGWEEVTGIEMTEEYIPIAKARIKFWRGWGKGRKPQGFTKETAEAHPSLF